MDLSTLVFVIHILTFTLSEGKTSSHAQLFGEVADSGNQGNCVYVKNLVQDRSSDWFYSNPLLPVDADSSPVLGLNSSTENVAQLLSETFGDSIKNGLFKVTPVRKGCDLIFCDYHGQYDLFRGEECIWSNTLETAFSTDTNTTGVKFPNNETHSYVKCMCNTQITDITFNSSWTGVIYSPYDKQKISGPCDNKGSAVCTPEWSSYTKDEIKAQINMVSSKFRQFSLYGAGTISEKHWSESEILSSRIPLYLAEMNRDAGFLRMQAVAGIFRLPVKDFGVNWVEKEKENAINLTIEANKIFPGSVWGISIQLNLFLDDNQFDLKTEIELTKKLLNDTKFSLRELGGSQLLVGLRVPQCSFLVKDETNGSRPEQQDVPYCDKENIYCPDPLLDDPYQDIMTYTDFVICAIPPWVNPPQVKKLYTMSTEVDNVGKKFLRTQYALRKVNRQIKLLGETGWPSQGKSSTNSPNNLINLRNYWVEMSKWSEKNSIFVYMFEALDEAWKNNNNPDDKSKAGLICGSEAYYGWWKRPLNSVPAEYVEKYTDITDKNVSSSIIDEFHNVSSECIDSKLLTDPNSASVKHLLIPLIVGSLAFLIIFIGVVSYMGRRLRIAQKSEAVLSRRYLEMFLNGVQSPGLSKEGTQDHYEVVALRFPYNKNKYELNHTQFEIDKNVLLGKGQSGTVYRGKINGNGSADKIVAFKTTDAFSSILDVKNLLSEIKIMSYIGEHQNVVCLLGACTDKLEKGIVFVALEFCSLGSLDKYLLNLRTHYKPPPMQSPPLENNAIASTNLSYVSAAYVEDPIMQTPPSSLGSSLEDFDFDFDILKAWAYEIANGMEFLASKKVVHADLATRNILLTGSKSIKITDFGLSRKLYHELGETFDPEVPLPWRWMSPQSLRRLTFSTETDVWSYGVTLWEIFSLGDVPYSAASFSGQFVQDLENGKRLEQPQYASSQIYTIMLNCWRLKPSERPDFSDLKREFQSYNSSHVDDDELRENSDTQVSLRNSYINSEALPQPIKPPEDSYPRYVNPCFAQTDYCNQELLS